MFFLSPLFIISETGECYKHCGFVQKPFYRLQLHNKTLWKKVSCCFFILNSSVKKYFVLFFLPQDYALGWVNLYKKFEIGNYSLW